MKGFRTIIANIIGATVLPYLVAQLKHVGVELTPEQQVTLTADILAALNMALRWVTTTPIGKAEIGMEALSEIKRVVPALYDMLVKEKQARAAKLSTESPT